MSRQEWLDASLDERAMVVAHYRVAKLIELHYAQKSAEDMKNRRG